MQISVLLLNPRVPHKGPPMHTVNFSDLDLWVIFPFLSYNSWPLLFGRCYWTITRQMVNTYSNKGKNGSGKKMKTPNMLAVCRKCGSAVGLGWISRTYFVGRIFPWNPTTRNLMLKGCIKTTGYSCRSPSSTYLPHVGFFSLRGNVKCVWHFCDAPGAFDATDSVQSTFFVRRSAGKTVKINLHEKLLFRPCECWTSSPTCEVTTGATQRFPRFRSQAANKPFVCVVTNMPARVGLQQPEVKWPSSGLRGKLHVQGNLLRN